MTNHPSRSAAARERELRSAVLALLSLHKRRDTFWYRTSSLHVFGEVMDRLAALTGSTDPDENLGHHGPKDRDRR